MPVTSARRVSEASARQGRSPRRLVSVAGTLLLSERQQGANHTIGPAGPASTHRPGRASPRGRKAARVPVISSLPREVSGWASKLGRRPGGPEPPEAGSPGGRTAEEADLREHWRPPDARRAAFLPEQAALRRTGHLPSSSIA